MRLAAVLIGAMLASVAVDAQAQQGVPSQAMLSDMGLSGMYVMTDDEAMAIRGSGFSWGVGSFHHYRHSVHKFHKWIHRFHKWVKHFRRHTKQIHGSIWKKHNHFDRHHSKFGKMPKHHMTKRW